MNKTLRILILEDNPADAELVQFELQEAGIEFTAKVVMTEKDYVHELTESWPDLILSDYDLPLYNGSLALAEAGRRCPDVPFILVTGAIVEDRAIEILTKGAKDYVLKTKLQQRLAPAVKRALAEAEEHLARKQAEAELREAHGTMEEQVKIRTAELQDSEKRYRRLFEAAKDGILILDAKTGKIDDVNPFLLKLLGYSYDDLYGKYIWELGVFKDIAASREVFKVLQDNEYIRYDDLPLETINGQIIAVEFVSNVYLIDHHKVIQCNIRDITEQKQVKDEKERILNDLQKERDRLQALINGIGDEIWFADTQKQFTLANPSALHEFGLKSDVDAIDMQKFAESLEVYRPDGSARPAEEAPPLRALKGEVVKNQEEMIRTPATGEIRYRQVSSNPVKDAGGKIIGSVSVSRDITELKKAEEALRESNENYRELVQNANSVIIRWKCDGTLVFFNEYAQSLFGYSADEIIGRNVSILVPEKESSGGDLTGLIQDIVANPANYINNVNENICRDGRRIWLAWTNKPIFDERGRVTEILAVAVDITERKRAEEELALNEREFRLLTESMPQIVWTTRADGWNTYFNQKWIDYTGLTLEESYGHGWNKPFHPDDQQRAWDAWQNAVLHNAPYLLQCRLRRADGIYRWWLIHGVPVLDEKGNIIKWYGTCTDINDLKLAEEAMLQSQNQFNSLIRNIRSGVALIDDAGKFTVVNPSFLRMFGLKDDETINNVNDKNWTAWQVFESDGTLLHVDEHPVRKAAITGRPVKDKLVGVRLPSGGDLIWMLISADLVRRTDGSIQSTICTYYDITELKRTEEILKESERKYRSIFENSIDAIFLAIPNQQVLAANPAACEIFGMTEEELCRVGRRGIEDPTDPRHIAAVEERARTGRVKYEATHVRKDGSKFPSEVNSVIMEAGLRSLVILRDITDRKRIEEALRESEEKFRILAESSPFAILMHQGDRWIYANPAAETISGYTKEDAGGMHFWDIVHPDHRNMVMQRGLDRQQGKAVPRSYEFKIIVKGGAEKWVNLTGTAIQYKNKPTTMISITDITDYKNMEISFIEQTRKLEEVNRELESFSYSVSHDLKAPLRAIEGYSRMLLKKDTDKFNEDTIRKLDAIRSSTDKMNALIEDLLSFSRVLKSSTTISEINMEKLAREVWAEIRATNMERKLELKITNMLPGKGDPALIRQVFLNLLSNAVKFTKTRKKGIIELNCYSEDGNVVYCVKDNGAGFDMAYYDKLFGVFQRLHSHEEYEGTGVGLAIVQRIIHRHGGRVWAEGEVDKGAAFYFTLPSTHIK